MNSIQLMKDHVRRARNLNHQAIGYRIGGGKHQRQLADQAFSRRDFYMGLAREVRERPFADVEPQAQAGPAIW